MPPYYFTLCAALTGGGAEFFRWPRKELAKAAFHIRSKILADRDSLREWMRFGRNDRLNIAYLYVRNGMA